MKNKILIFTIVTMLTTVLALEINLKNDSLSALTMANLEALAEPTETTSCPDPYDVPNRFLRGGGPQSATYQSNSSGQIIVGGKTLGGYAKNTSVTITVETFNCDGVQTGACCNQKKVGTFPI